MGNSPVSGLGSCCLCRDTPFNSRTFAAATAAEEVYRDRPSTAGPQGTKNCRGFFFIAIGNTRYFRERECALSPRFFQTDDCHSGLGEARTPPRGIKYHSAARICASAALGRLDEPAPEGGTGGIRVPSCGVVDRRPA